MLRARKRGPLCAQARPPCAPSFLLPLWCRHARAECVHRSWFAAGGRLLCVQAPGGECCGGRVGAARAGRRFAHAACGVSNRAPGLTPNACRVGSKAQAERLKAQGGALAGRCSGAPLQAWTVLGVQSLLPGQLHFFVCQAGNRHSWAANRACCWHGVARRSKRAHAHTHTHTQGSRARTMVVLCSH